MVPRSEVDEPVVEGAADVELISEGSGAVYLQRRQTRTKGPLINVLTLCTANPQ